MNSLNGNSTNNFQNNDPYIELNSKQINVELNYNYSNELSNSKSRYNDLVASYSKLTNNELSKPNYIFKTIDESNQQHKETFKSINSQVLANDFSSQSVLINNSEKKIDFDIKLSDFNIYCRNLINELIDQRLSEFKVVVSGIIFRIKSDPILISLASASSVNIINSSNQEKYNKIFDRENETILNRIEEILLNSLNSSSEKIIHNKIEELTSLKYKTYQIESERNKYLQTINSLNQEIESINNKLQISENQLNHHKNEINKINYKYNEFLNSTQNKFSSIQSEHFNKIQELENKYLVENKKVDQLKNNLISIEENQSANDNTLNQLEAEISRLNKIISVYEINFGEMDDLIKEKNSKIENIKLDNGKFVKENLELNLKNKYLNEEILLMKMRIEDLEKKIKNLNEENNKLSNSEKSLISKNKELLNKTEQNIKDKFSSIIKEREIFIDGLKSKLSDKDNEISYFKDQLENTKNMISTNVNQMQNEVFSIKKEMEEKYYKLESQHSKELLNVKHKFEIDYIKILSKSKQEKEDLLKEVSNLNNIVLNYKDIEKNYICKEKYELEKIKIKADIENTLKQENEIKNKFIEEEFKNKIKQLDLSKKQEYEFLIENYKNTILSLETKNSNLENEKINSMRSLNKQDIDINELKSKIENLEKQIKDLNKNLQHENQVSENYLEQIKLIENKFDQYITETSSYIDQKDNQIKNMFEDLEETKSEVQKLKNYIKLTNDEHNQVKSYLEKELDETKIDKEKSVENYKQMNKKILEDFKIIDIKNIKLNEEIKFLNKKNSEIESYVVQLEIKLEKNKNDFENNSVTINKLYEELKVKEDEIKASNLKLIISNDKIEKIEKLKTNLNIFSNKTLILLSSIKELKAEILDFKSNTKLQLKNIMTYFCNLVNTIKQKFLDLISKEKLLNSKNLKKLKIDLNQQYEQNVNHFTSESNEHILNLKNELIQTQIDKENLLSEIERLNIFISKIQIEIKYIQEDKEKANFILDENKRNNKDEIESLKSKIVRKEQEISQIIEEKQKLENKVNTLFQENSEFTLKLQKLKFVLEEEKDSYSIEKNKFISQNQELEAKIVSLKIEIENIKMEIIKLKTRIEDERKISEKLKKEKEDQENIISSIKKDLNNKDKKISELNSNLLEEKIISNKLKNELENKDDELIKLNRLYNEKFKLKEKNSYELQLLIDQTVSKFDNKNLNIAEQLDEDIKVLMRKLKLDQENK